MKIYDIKIQFFEGKCFMQIAKYSNGRTAIQLYDAEDGIPLCKATVNMPEINIEPDELIIKDYSENEGLFDWLVLNEIVIPSITFANNGFVSCPITKFHPSFDLTTV